MLLPCLLSTWLQGRLIAPLTKAVELCYVPTSVAPLYVTKTATFSHITSPGDASWSLAKSVSLPPPYLGGNVAALLRGDSAVRGRQRRSTAYSTAYRTAQHTAYNTAYSIRIQHSTAQQHSQALHRSHTAYSGAAVSKPVHRAWGSNIFQQTTNSLCPAPALPPPCTHNLMSVAECHLEAVSCQVRHRPALPGLRHRPDRPHQRAAGDHHGIFPGGWCHQWSWFHRHLFGTHALPGEWVCAVTTCVVLLGAQFAQKVGGHSEQSHV